MTIHHAENKALTVQDKELQAILDLISLTLVVLFVISTHLT
jgi:hypothetical protein